MEHKCRLCGTLIRADDAIIVVEAEPLHVACAEPPIAPSVTWRHTAVTTLSQWARGIGWGSSAGA